MLNMITPTSSSRNTHTGGRNIMFASRANAVTADNNTAARTLPHVRRIILLYNAVFSAYVTPLVFITFSVSKSLFVKAILLFSSNPVVVFLV